MKTWAGLAVVGFVLVAGISILRPDMKGWTPRAWGDPATIVEPLDENGARFSVGDCLPGTIEVHGAPGAHDYEGTATMTVFTCRSRSSAVKITVLYLLLALSYPVYHLATRERSK